MKQVIHSPVVCGSMLSAQFVYSVTLSSKSTLWTALSINSHRNAVSINQSINQSIRFIVHWTSGVDIQGA